MMEKSSTKSKTFSRNIKKKNRKKQNKKKKIIGTSIQKKKNASQ